MFFGPHIGRWWWCRCWICWGNVGDYDVRMQCTEHKCWCILYVIENMHKTNAIEINTNKGK